MRNTTFSAKVRFQPAREVQSCRGMCHGNHPHIAVTEVRIGDAIEVADDDGEPCVRIATRNRYEVRGQSKRAGIHTCGMEFALEARSRREVLSLIRAWERREV